MMISEQVVQDSFHSYLKSSLAQAKAERLLDADILSSAESDLMITGPALCLYFAALRSTTHPPSVPLPRSAASKPIDLSYDNCPPAFISFLRVWANTVPSIQDLVPEAQHDLARVICGLHPLLYDHQSASSPIIIIINGIAADLRAVAIEISQRRSFQDRYASDLQAALDSGNNTPSPRKASFVPPPVYDDDNDSVSSSSPSVQSSFPPPKVPPKNFRHNNNNIASPPPPPPRSPRSPSLFRQDSPAIEFIRETLYASLADVLERQSSLHHLLQQDPPRAYFASVAFAILDVSLHAITPDGSVIGILGNRLRVSECPSELRPFMLELSAIGKEAKRMDEEDNENAMRLIQQGQDIPLSRLDRVRLMLEKGVGYQHDDDDDDISDGRRSVEGRAVTFANKVNALGLALTKLKPFRERQEYVFKVLGAVGS